MYKNFITPNLLRLAGAASFVSGLLFFVGVQLQMSTGWFPEVALTDGEMTPWLETVAASRNITLAGVGFSIAAIMLFMVVGLVVYRFLADEQPTLALLGLAGYLTGVPLALVAFLFGFGATWGLMDAANATESALPTAFMRSFLVMDDIATFLIASIGNGFFSFAAWRSKQFPRWLSGHGFLVAVLITIVLFRYIAPVFGAATIGYPLLLLWFILLGVVLFRKASGQRQSAQLAAVAAAEGDPAG